MLKGGQYGHPSVTDPVESVSLPVSRRKRHRVGLLSTGLSFLSFVFFFHYCVSSSVSRQKYHPIDNIIRQTLSKGACVRYWLGRGLVYVCPML